jgi:hypothetical protein
MSLNLGGNTITRVDIVDDKPDARKIMAMTVDEANLEPVLENNQLPPLSQFVTAAIGKTDAAICDYKLSLGKYAQFNGAEAVAKFYDSKWPALLCTTYGKADIDAMRLYRRKIPVLIRTENLSPDTIAMGFEYCIRELKTNFSPDRKPWRTMVRIEEVDKEMVPPMFFVVLPGWCSIDKIRLPLDIIPSDLQKNIKPGVRFHAQVNKGAENQDDLYFDNFEFD